MSQPVQSPSANGSSDPYSKARFDQWAARAYWTPAEIAALSLGKHPWSLCDARANEHLENWFTWEFWERRDVFARAAEMGRISWQCPPNKAVEYLKQLGIPFAPGLEEAVQRFHPLMNWEEACETVLRWAKKTQTEHQQQLADHQTALATAQRETLDAAAWQEKALALIEELIAENDAVTQRLETMESAVSSAEPTGDLAANDNDDALPPKLQTSYDWIVAAAAIYGYGYDPAADRSDIGTQIAGDIANIGGSLTPPVASNHVRGACKRLGITKRPDAQD